MTNTNTKAKIYTVGSNVPGCLPETAPDVFTSLSDARDFLVECIDNAAENCDEDKCEAGYAMAREVMREEPQEVDVEFDGRIYFLASREPQTVCEALALHCGDDLDDVQEQTWEHYDLSTYSTGNAEWAVGTCDEATDAAETYIRESLWSFRPDFLVNYCSDGVDADVLRTIAEAKCEDANDAFLALVGDSLQNVLDDAIATDGRGHFLSHHDGEEVEIEVGGETLYAYRTN